LYKFLNLKQKELRGILSIYYAYPTCQPLSHPAHPIFEEWKGCWVPGEFCIILANGTVVPCAMARSRKYWAGNALEDGFLNVWRNSSVFKEFRKMHNEHVRGKCVRCRYTISCGGGCRFLSDRLGKKPFYPDPRCAYDPDSGVDMFEFYHKTSPEGDNSESAIG
jgi:radical SAM protein with 4Fe4S-binding SPASM domain